MATSFQSFWGLFISLSLYIIHSTSTNHVHIVYLGHNNAHDPLITTEHHIKLLSTVFPSEDYAKQAMVYSYKHTFSGFAAKLNSTQATTLARMGGVISVFKSKTLRLHTTRSWDFMGLTLHGREPLASPLQWTYADDIVVGIFDTGIWPESESFREEPGVGPIPFTWKGTCERGEKFDPTKACNRKLIGARYYLKGFESEYGPLDSDYRSARDRLGHGTHTASVAVGSVQKNASFFGLGHGTARGGAPRARLAVYKVCWNKDLVGRCTEADILAGYDDAIRDGVNVISASLGMSPPLLPFFSSSSDIGSFHAVQMGVSVIFSAGNNGPDPSMVENVAPWGTCVAGSTIDRTFPTQILLGNNISIMGEGFIVQQMNVRISDSSRYFKNGICELDKWNDKKFATGRIIICFSTIGPQLSGNAALAVFAANGSGMIYAAPITRQFAQVDLIPTIYVNLYQGSQIQDYALSQSSRSRRVQILPSKTIIRRSPAPTVAYFSSRGPSSRSPNILKPDITAPGVNILAAWPSKIPPTTLPIDFRSVNWNFDSGTSMSCPHVSGIVALIKSAHPDWSPAAIKSAMMTTAYTRDTSLDKILAGGTLKASDPFDIGSGHVDPLKAIDPGLVYDMDTQDYILFLCSIGYTKEQIGKMILPSPKIEINCPNDQASIDIDLNYPAIVVSNLRSTMTIKRTLRNVGHSRAIYFVNFVSLDGVEIVIWPMVLFFSWHKEKISYYVTLTPLKHSQGRYDFGNIVWSDGYHQVKSPLVVCVNNTGGVGHVETHPTL